MLCAVLLLATSAFAENTYIVPMYGVAGGSWYPQITITNPHDQPVSVRIVRGYPMISGRCVNCIEHPPVDVGAKSTLTLHPFWSDTRDFVVAGAYELSASAPVRVDAMYFGFEMAEVRQRLDTAQAWLPAGEHLATAQSGVNVRRNALVVNPNAFAIEVSIWLGERSENERRILVPAHATRMVPVREPSCDPEGCALPPDYPPRPAIIHFDSPAPFLGGVSSIGPSWAMFSLAGDLD
jgi:hypothetical protein